MSIGFIFSHGWGLSPAFWENLRPFFAEYPCIVWDQGYFGSKQQEIPVNQNVQWIGIGHSLGLTHLLESPIPFAALIGLQSFLRFCAHNPSQAGASQKVLEKMEKALILDPKNVLHNFHQHCGFEPKTSDNINIPLLTKDLSFLKTHDASKRFSMRKIPSYFLATYQDPIVTQALSLELAQNFKQLKLDFYDGAHHSLGYHSAEKCATAIQSFLSGTIK